MAGTINLALTQQFDMDGEPLSGGVLYFFAAATTTPQSAFQDTGLTIPWPNPITLDASGRIPMFYLADGNIKIRLATKTGVTVIAADNLLVIGPSSGGGGGGGVDATTVLQTGDIKARFETGSKDGFVRCNGGTIGSLGAAGVTERGNADCQALFEYLWSTTVLQVFSGTSPNRGTTANGDWTANKVIALPDLRGRTIAGMDDMGAASGAAGRLTSAFFGASGIVLGNAGGSQSKSIVAANLPTHSHNGGGTSGLENQAFTHNFSGTTGGADRSLDHTHSYTDRTFAPSNSTAAGGNPPGGSPSAVGDNTGTSSGGSLDHLHFFSGTTGGQNQNHNHNFSFTTDGGIGLANSAFAVASPAMVMTFYIKL